MDDKYAIPVSTLTEQMLNEKFPALDAKKGSAVNALLNEAFNPLLQNNRDKLGVLVRNMSLQNYQVMADDELDALASNHLVYRRDGTYAFHTQRVYFSSPQMTVIGTGAVFADDNNHYWRPVTATTVGAAAMTNSVDLSTGEYYVDVIVRADQTGEAYIALPNTVNRLSGVGGASITTNLLQSSGGSNVESNSEMYARIKNGIANRAMISGPGIQARIMSEFTGINEARVVGFGDSGMTRDTIDAVVKMDSLFQVSFCKKVNVPLNEDGDVEWVDSEGNIIVNPRGGYVGVIQDQLGKDFNAIDVTLDGSTLSTLSVQPGMVLRLYSAGGADTDGGDYSIKAVEEVSIAPNGTAVKVIRVDRPFTDPELALWDVATDYEKYKYTVMGPVVTKTFHTGGKVDCYLDTDADTAATVIISQLPDSGIVEGFSTTSGVATIPITTSNVEVDTGNLFVSPFQLPLITITAVYEVGPNDADIWRELTPGVHWFLTRQQHIERFSTVETDVLTVTGFDSDGYSLFSGSKIRIDYITNPDIPMVQTFVDSSGVRNLGMDIEVKAKDIVLADVVMTFSGTITQEDARSVVGEYITGRTSLSVYDINSVLSLFGATDIQMPVRLTGRRVLDSGSVEVDVSEDRLSVEITEKFMPVDTLSISKV